MPIQLRLQERYLRNWVEWEGKCWVETCAPWRVLRGKGRLHRQMLTFWSRKGKTQRPGILILGSYMEETSPLAAWGNAKTDRKAAEAWTPLVRSAQVLACQQSIESLPQWVLPHHIPLSQLNGHHGPAHSTPQHGTGSRAAGSWEKTPPRDAEANWGASDEVQVEQWQPLLVVTQIAPQKQPRLLTQFL